MVNRARIGSVIGGMVAAALALASAAQAAGPGFGYDDPRSAILKQPSYVSATPSGGFLLSEAHGHGPIRRYSPGRELVRIAGGGHREVRLQPIPATEASLFAPSVTEPLDGGGFLVAAGGDGIVARVSATGQIVRVAGIPLGGSGSGGPPGTATDTHLDGPDGLASTGDGGFLLTERYSYRIREVMPGGTISTVAGTGEFGITPDGAMAKGSPIGGPNDAVAEPGGGFVFSEDAGGYAAIRRVSPGGVLSTIAGGPSLGFSGDGGPARLAQLDNPTDIDIAADGSILFVDSGNQRIRRISPDGVISTVAGTGETRYNGDGIPAVDAPIVPRSVSVTADGGFLIGDFANGRVRKVSPGGTISTLAGMPAPSSCDDAPYNGIQGTTGNDELRGAELRDLIRGEIGDDVIGGRGGSDCLVGGIDDDVISGGPKGDAIDAENGNDRVVGGIGDDYVSAQDGRDRVSGGAGSDELYGGFADDRVSGGAGDDYISGNTGLDHLSGGKGDDYIEAQYNERESYAPAHDVVRCGPGNDTVKANTYDRVAKSCEHLKGAIANR